MCTPFRSPFPIMCILISVKVMLSLDTISSRTVHLSSELPLGLDVNCTLTAKKKPSYMRTVTFTDTRHEYVAQGTVDNLVPYTNYTATCQVFKDGVDLCYNGSDTTQTYTDSGFKCSNFTYS